MLRSSRLRQALARTGPADTYAADTAWMIVATALVLMMTTTGPGARPLPMVCKKNVLAQSLAAVATISISSGWRFGFAGLHRRVHRWFLIGMTIWRSPAAKNVGSLFFMLYQMTFVQWRRWWRVVADRMTSSAYLMFSVGWFTFVCLTMGGGFLRTRGVLDFAASSCIFPPGVLRAGGRDRRSAAVTAMAARTSRRSTCRSP